MRDKKRTQTKSELSERARRKLDSIMRPDGTLDTDKLTFVDNQRSIDDWFADIEVEECRPWNHSHY